MSALRDLIIIGSGPSGYTAAIYAARAGLKPLVLAGSVEAGGALMTTTEVENFPGFPEGVQGPDLMEALQEQAERFGAEVLFTDVVKADLTGEVKVLTDGEGGEHQARTVILSMGAAYRKLGLPEEESFTGHGLSWCATCDGFFFRDKEVLVVGGGDSAMEEATFLTRFAKTVTVVHRRGDLRASKIMAQRAMENEKISFIWNAQVAEVRGEGKVSSVLLRDTITGEEREVPTDGVFVAIGHDPRSALVKEEVHVDAEGYVLVEGRTSKTNLPGVFACGDLVDHEYRQAITAAGSGCAAALDAQRYLESLDA